jgi:hypothetical protein
MNASAFLFILIISTLHMANYTPTDSDRNLKSFFFVGDKMKPSLIRYTFHLTECDRNFNLPKLFFHFLVVDPFFWEMMTFSDRKDAK